MRLPQWYDALNQDFRYQLTAIGTPAPGLYVAREISRSHFRMAGGKPGAKVSWQVTGTRKDPWAQANRITPEEKKPKNERGRYLHPELYGKPAAAGIHAESNSSLAHRIEEKAKKAHALMANQQKATLAAAKFKKQHEQEMSDLFARVAERKKPRRQRKRKVGR